MEQDVLCFQMHWSVTGGDELLLSCLTLADKPVLVPGIHRPALKVRGLGLEGEPAAEEVLAVCFRERPDDVQQLLSGASTQRLVQLAALSESLDHSADAILRLAGLQGGLSATDKRRRGGVVGVAAAVVRSTRLAGGLGPAAPTAPNAAITDMLAHMVDRCGNALMSLLPLPVQVCSREC